MRPDTSYALDGDVHIAYQVLGTGSRDLLLVPEFWHSIEAQWELPELAAFLERLAGLGRLICFDQRGSGLSDPIALDEVPSLELWMNDIRVVLEAVGSERATLVAFGGGVATSILYAAANPQRVPALVLVNGYARVRRAPDYPARLGRSSAAGYPRRHDCRLGSRSIPRPTGAEQARRRGLPALVGSLAAPRRQPRLRCRAVPGARRHRRT